MPKRETKLSAELVKRDRAVVWHPYSAMQSEQPLFPVVSAEGVYLRLADGRRLIDGMSSWWCAIHGYNHPHMNHVVQAQLEDMAHVMFGGLTHPAAIELAERLVQLTPEPLQRVFFADSGSVAVEVALKMAMQYWVAKGHAQKRRFLALRQAYHGDTFHCMSVCDPVTGMHSLFGEVLPKQVFAEAPQCGFEQPCTDDDLHSIKTLMELHRHELAAVILEPVVQGAGGMRFYSPDYLRRVRGLCDELGVLLIVDEIATGFGRTGKLFASEHAQISADILCVGKALTGGYLSLAATLTTCEVSEVIDGGDPGLFMHGPTFMANPLACAAGLASLEILSTAQWQVQVQAIEAGLKVGLAACEPWPWVAEVRVLGAIGVVELQQPVNMATIQQQFVEAGVWVRPFGKLVYLMPPYIISTAELAQLTAAVCRVVSTLGD
ncbi:MAG: adenosylmethionine--8-amino-7-oxononanoate transaminase [Gammaproteobacteria bacterium]|nr:adenosylmethionine--8-amino-7-oxononanoate transaminase [Gammaproteobacteria bacterium]